MGVRVGGWGTRGLLTGPFPPLPFLAQDFHSSQSRLAGSPAAG